MFVHNARVKRNTRMRMFAESFKLCYRPHFTVGTRTQISNRRL